MFSVWINILFVGRGPTELYRKLYAHFTGIQQKFYDTTGSVWETPVNSLRYRKPMETLRQVYWDSTKTLRELYGNPAESLRGPSGNTTRTLKELLGGSKGPRKFPTRGLQGSCGNSTGNITRILLQAYVNSTTFMGTLRELFWKPTEMFAQNSAENCPGTLWEIPRKLLVYRNFTGNLHGLHGNLTVNSTGTLRELYANSTGRL